MGLRDILAGGTASLIESVGTVLDNLFTSTEEKERAKLALLQVQLAAQTQRDAMLADIEKAYLADQANLRDQIKVEIQSQDWFVRRARPALGWLFLVILAWNYVGLTIAQLAFGKALAPIELPPELWMMCGVWFVGYGVMRSMDKRASVAGAVMATGVGADGGK